MLADSFLNLAPKQRANIAIKKFPAIITRLRFSSTKRPKLYKIEIITNNKTRPLVLL